MTGTPDGLTGGNFGGGSYMTQNDPHDALIILRYVSLGGGCQGARTTPPPPPRAQTFPPPNPCGGLDDQDRGWGRGQSMSSDRPHPNNVLDSHVALLGSGAGEGADLRRRDIWLRKGGKDGSRGTPDVLVTQNDRLGALSVMDHGGKVGGFRLEIGSAATCTFENRRQRSGGGGGGGLVQPPTSPRAFTGEHATGHLGAVGSAPHDSIAHELAHGVPGLCRRAGRRWAQGSGAWDQGHTS